MKRRMLKSEMDYEAPNKTTIEYLTLALETNRTITGIPIDYNLAEKVIIVDLGNGFYGELPFNEVTIEPLKYIHGNSVPVQVKMLVQKRVIRIKVTKIENSKIFLSRKKNLLEILKFYKENSNVKVDAVIVGATDFGVFCDIGDGLIALCHYSEMSRARIFPKKFVKIGTKVNVMVYPNKKSEDMLNCSIKRATIVNYSEIKSGDIIKVKVGQPIYNEEGKLTGYFVEITPAISGIADIQCFKDNSVRLKNGQIVDAYVRSVIASKHKVKLTIKEHNDFKRF